MQCHVLCLKQELKYLTVRTFAKPQTHFRKIRTNNTRGIQKLMQLGEFLGIS